MRILVRPGRPAARPRRGTAAVVAATVAAVVVTLVAPAQPAAAAGPSFERTPLWVYGHSFAASPGNANTPGQEWMPKVAAALGMPGWRTYGVGGSRLVDVYGDVSRQGPTRPSSTSAWRADRRGVVVLQAEFNDSVNPPAGGDQRAVPLSAAAAADYGQTLQATLAVLASSGRVDLSGGRASSGWWRSSGPAYLGGSLAVTDEPFAWREVPVSVGRSGTVWVVTWEISAQQRSGTGTGATAIEVDGRRVATLPAQRDGWATINSRRGGGPVLHRTGPRATRISGLTPGRHVLRVAKADRGPGAVFLDQVLVQAAAPVPVVVVEDPPPSVLGEHWSTRGKDRETVVANQRSLHTQIATVVRGFPNVATAALADGIALYHYSRDGVHLSDAGMDHEARVVEDALRRLTASYAPATMYR